jgi:hypothetical protein
MREDEAQHFEVEDIDAVEGWFHIQDKPHLGWETKTVASIRDIPIGHDLLRASCVCGCSSLQVL